ncbi:Crp/Fnr family transcriptional regulator [Sphingomonas parva]|uniref:Crp/Fnr family transcriptional regulator n=1 Tax=Sphingomonas parva TaxID=2555898 RepID=A0A4Y8ZKQ8_9SPHN|nr:Crp/Fnr family transcriptional regulator [Sphingomonas parva]TFI56591.1 Crp/Fnr family transcriptional regulator [Sphingomonas parva]
MIDRFLMKLRARDEIGPEEEQALRDAISDVRDVPADQVVIRAGQEMTVCTLLLDGLMCRYKDLAGGQRQISELHVAGDFADLHSFTLKRLDHNILALTPCRIALAPHERIAEITERLPHLTRMLWFSTNLDAAIHREWELSLGRRTALARVAHLFCELQIRLGIVGLADETGYELKLTQTDMAECLGLTSVHVNRTLKELREGGLVEFRNWRVTILDQRGLEQAAEFNPDYLYLDQQPR